MLSALGAALGVFIAYGLGYFFGILVGGALGYAAGALLGKALLGSSMPKHRGFPAVEELLAKGWEFGEKPS